MKKRKKKQKRVLPGPQEEGKEKQNRVKSSFFGGNPGPAWKAVARFAKDESQWHREFVGAWSKATTNGCTSCL